MKEQYRVYTPKMIEKKQFLRILRNNKDVKRQQSPKNQTFYCVDEAKKVIYWTPMYELTSTEAKMTEFDA
jgi:DNA-binding transcriptional MerR regulator